MTEAVATLKGRKLDARYTLLDKLGAGGQGEVWRAHDATRGVDIALKVLNPSAQQDEAWGRLEHEYAIASRLDHPSILKVFPPERSGDAMIQPMELASGGDLRRLRGAGFLEIIPVLLEIAQALEHAHERGVVHRDLKPGNVLFDARGRARLADFGVAETAMTKTDAKGPGPAAASPDTNRHGFSPFTASPAQLRGEPPAPADDIYGLGALAYELLSGYPPYYPHFDKKRAIEEPVPKLVPTRQIPPLLGTLVMHLLEKNPRKRPRTMREVIDELDAALNDTLTYDFENALPSASSAAPSQPGPAQSLPQERVSQPSQSGAARTPDAPAKSFEWTPTSGDRRASADRRGRRKEDLALQIKREPTISSDLSDVGVAGADRPTARSGAEALARIDAAIERAAGESEAQPPKPQQPAQITPAEAAAIVAAARAAAAKQSPTPPPNASVPPVSAQPQPASRMWPRSGDTTAGSASTKSPDFARTPSSPAEHERAVPPAQARAPTTSRASAPAAGTYAAALQPVSSASGTYANPTSSGSGAMHTTWGEIPLDRLPALARLQPIRPRRWPWVLFGLLAGGAAAVYFWLPRFDTQTLPPEVAAVVEPLKSALTPDSASSSTEASSGASTAATPTGTPSTGAPGSPDTAAKSEATQPAVSPAATSSPPMFTPEDEQRLRGMRQAFDTRLATLESRGAGVWGGREFAMAKTRAAESVGARDAGNPRVAQERLATAMKLLDTVESRAPQALSAQVAAGEKALGTGQQEVAGQAFDLARRISPNDRRASDGQRRAQNLNAVLPLLADAQNAEAAHDYARAAQDYSQALFLDPGNAAAKAGQARANAAFGDDNYAKAVGTGFASLGAGRLDAAHDAFVKARALKPNGAEALEGLRRVGAALTARGFASMRQRAAGLEAQERWEEAERAYEDVLAADPSLAFALEGKARTSSRADLSARLQQLLDRPDRLASPGVRQDARALLETARAQSPQGPVIRSQIARLEILLPGFDKPVRLSLLSDNSTQVAISSVGSFGSFARRDIELRPGKYTVLGTRNGFRDVRREITVAPGQETQTIRVTCSEPI